jgi:hypothetical protein
VRSSALLAVLFRVSVSTDTLLVDRIGGPKWPSYASKSGTKKSCGELIPEIKMNRKCSGEDCAEQIEGLSLPNLDLDLGK